MYYCLLITFCQSHDFIYFYISRAPPFSDNGHVYTFGSNQYGQLGIGNCDITRNVCHVPSLTDVIRVTCGDTFTVAVTKGMYIPIFTLCDHPQMR